MVSCSWVRISARAICIGRVTGFDSLCRGNGRAGRRRGGSGGSAILFWHEDFQGVAARGAEPRSSRRARTPERSDEVSVIGELATKSQPILVEFAANLTYPAGADAVLPRKVERSLAGHHVADKAAVAVGAGP